MIRNLGIAAAAVLAVAAPLASAQQMTSDSFAFLEAVRKGDGNKVMEFVDKPGSTVLNSKERGTGDAALHLVVRDRNMNWLLYLLGKGAKPDIQNNQGNTPLALAAQLGWAEGAGQLLVRRAAVDLPNNAGETPLIQAVHKRDLTLVRLLLSVGADPNRTDSVAGFSALDYAKRDPRNAAIARILESGPAKPQREAQGPVL